MVRYGSLISILFQMSKSGGPKFIILIRFGFEQNRGIIYMVCCKEMMVGCWRYMVIFVCHFGLYQHIGILVGNISLKRSDP